MALLNKLFGTRSSNEERSLPWIALDKLTQLDEIIKNSYQKPQLLFKHSTRCGISSMVLRQFESNYPFIDNEVDLFYLDLLSYRAISNEIAIRFGVYHESPQLLIVKNGQVIKHASHGTINDLDLMDLL